MDLLDEVDESELTQILKEYGELQRPRGALVLELERIIPARPRLVEAVEGVIPKKPDYIQTLVFQAIRIVKPRT